jgi:hypothetical protein
MKVNDAATPRNLTDVTPLKRVPLSMTVVPIGPNVGLNVEINGAPGPSTVKLPALSVVPPGVWTATCPVVAPAGTMAVICVPAPFTVNPAETPLNRTANVPVNLEPLMLTLWPTPPLVGLSPVMIGAPIVTVKLALLCAAPFGVMTVMGPLTAPLGTVVRIWVPAAFVLNPAGIPLNLTDDAPTKPVPLMVTPVPVGPLVGVKFAILGEAPAQAWSDMIDATRATTTAEVPSILDARRTADVRLIWLVLPALLALNNTDAEPSPGLPGSAKFLLEATS